MIKDSRYLDLEKSVNGTDRRDHLPNLSVLPNATMLVLEGQQHNAMDSAREKLAELITTFILGRGDKD